MSDVFRAKGIFGDIEGVMVDVRGAALLISKNFFCYARRG
jgi:hypothetical protein